MFRAHLFTGMPNQMSLDLSNALRMQPDEGFDPVNAGHIDPKFGGQTSANDGMPFISDGANNREWTIPVLLKAHETSRTNLVDNPKCSVDTTNYAAGGGSTISRVVFGQDTIYGPDDNSLLTGIKHVAASSDSWVDIAVASNLTNGVAYTLSCWVYATMNYQIQVVKVGTGAYATKDVTTGLNAWQRVSLNFTPNTTGDYNIAIDNLGPANPAGTAYVTGFLLETGSSTKSYFDGDSLDAEWAGTPNNSTSTTVTGLSGVHKMVRKINNTVGKSPMMLRLEEQSTEGPTFYDVETGQLDVNYNYYHAISSLLTGTLKLWSRPFGHTATLRAPTTITATGPRQFSLPTVMGDVEAKANLAVRMGSYVASGGRVFAWGITPYGRSNSVPSRYIRWPSYLANAGDMVAQSSSVATGASGAVGSTYVAIPVSPTTTSGVALTDYFTSDLGGNLDARPGRYRVFGVYRSALSGNRMSLYARDALGNAIGPTVVASQNSNTKWSLADFGEINIPSDAGAMYRGSGALRMEIIAGGASTASAAMIASPALHFNSLIYLPVSYNAGMLNFGGYNQFTNSVLISNIFKTYDPVWYNPYPMHGHRTVQNDYWWQTFGYLYRIPEIVIPLTASGTQQGGATGQYSIASGKMMGDISLRSIFDVGLGSGRASGAEIEYWLKNINATVGVRAKIVCGPSANISAALISHDGTGTTLHASAALGASLASTINMLASPPGLVYVDARVQNSNILLWLNGSSAQNPTPILNASHAFFANRGHVALQMKSGGGLTSMFDGLRLSTLDVYDLTASVPFVEQSNLFSIQSYPKPAVVRHATYSNATLISADVRGYYRGDYPKTPPVNTASSGDQVHMVVFTGDPLDFRGNDYVDITLYYNERFTFLR